MRISRYVFASSKRFPPLFHRSTWESAFRPMLSCCSCVLGHSWSLLGDLAFQRCRRVKQCQKLWTPSKLHRKTNVSCFFIFSKQLWLAMIGYLRSIFKGQIIGVRPPILRSLDVWYIVLQVLCTLPLFSTKAADVTLVSLGPKCLGDSQARLFEYLIICWGNLWYRGMYLQ